GTATVRPCEEISNYGIVVELIGSNVHLLFVALAKKGIVRYSIFKDLSLGYCLLSFPLNLKP
ncbi:MAG: hypothetical protein KAH15_06215, partial [Candidatus Marinimicrobia bacterium]|nr:hypothetical protein [Candidatus Neomarinimicrobiota bacterium]